MPLTESTCRAMIRRPQPSVKSWRCALVFGQASRQVWSGNCDLPDEPSLQVSYRRLEVTLEEHGSCLSPLVIPKDVLDVPLNIMRPLVVTHRSDAERASRVVAMA